MSTMEQTVYIIKFHLIVPYSLFQKTNLPILHNTKAALPCNKSVYYIPTPSVSSLIVYSLINGYSWCVQLLRN